MYSGDGAPWAYPWELVTDPIKTFDQTFFFEKNTSSMSCALIIHDWKLYFEAK